MRRTTLARLTVGISMMALIGLMVPNGAHAAAVGWVLTLEVDHDRVSYGDTVALAGRVTDGPTGAPIEWADVWLDGTYPAVHASSDADGRFSAEWAVAYGFNWLRAAVSHYIGMDWNVDYSPSILVAGTSPTQTTIDPLQGPVAQGRPFDVTVGSMVEASGKAFVGSYQFRDVASGSLIPATCDSVSWLSPPAVCHLAGLGQAGTREVVAELEAYEVFEPMLPSVSEPVTVEVTPDTELLLAAPTVSATRFYPVRDGYKDDIVTTGFVTGETATLTFKVKSVATGRIVLTDNEGTMLWPGDYAWSWNGRRSDGSLAPEGSYRILHVVQDPFGNVRTLTSPSFVLSYKKLVWVTASSVTKRGASYAGTTNTMGGWASKTKSSYSGGVRISLPGSLGMAGVKYEFYLPKVTIPSTAIYRRLTFAVRGKGISRGSAEIGIHNEHLGSWTGLETCDVWRSTGSAYAWYSTTTSSTAAHTQGHKVRAMVWTEDTWDIDDVRATLKYAVLK